MYFQYHVLAGILLSIPLAFRDLLRALAFLMGSIVMDADHLITFLLLGSRVYEDALRIAKTEGMWKAVEYLKEHHKEVDNLLLHNIVSFYGIVVCLSLLLLVDPNILSDLLTGMLVHSAIDQMDDIHAIRSLRNWLWPLAINPGFRTSLVIAISSSVISAASYLVIILT